MRKRFRTWSSWGVTTGGMLSTERDLKQGRRIPRFSPYHAAGSVAEVLAEECGCRGLGDDRIHGVLLRAPWAIKLALEVLRQGGRPDRPGGGGGFPVPVDLLRLQQPADRGPPRRPSHGSGIDRA